MPRPWRIRYAGAKYHLTARGNGREAIFVETKDYERFLEQLTDAVEKDEVVLYAYVLMPNHYHLLVRTPLGNVQRFMQRLNTACGMYFRYKKQRPGHCFQGRYGATLVDGDDYLVRLTRYIHLNPVKTRPKAALSFAEKKKYLEEYDWSSYRSYVGLEKKRDWMDYHWLKLMGRMTDRRNQVAYKKYVEQMMGGEDAVLREARDRSMYAVGDQRFAEQTEEDIKVARFTKIDTGDIRWPVKRRKSLEEAVKPILKELDLSKEDLRMHGRAVGVKKMMAIELLCRLSSASQRELMPICGYKRESSVGKQRSALRSRLNADHAFAGRFDMLQNKLGKALTC